MKAFLVTFTATPAGSTLTLFAETKPDVLDVVRQAHMIETVALGLPPAPPPPCSIREVPANELLPEDVVALNRARARSAFGRSAKPWQVRRVRELLDEQFGPSITERLVAVFAAGFDDTVPVIVADALERGVAALPDETEPLLPQLQAQLEAAHPMAAADRVRDAVLREQAA
jgi:hypothetical protein